MRSDRRGFALLAVLWALVIAAALAAELHTAARGDRRGALAAQQLARARWAARGGLAHAEDALRAKLASRSAVGAAPETDTLIVPPEELDFDGVRVRVMVVDARSKVQLNLAGADELRALFAAVGVAPDRAYTLAAEVVRWRVEHGPRVEARATDPAAMPLRPPRGAFRSVGQLRDVPGVGDGVYRAAAPYLTVAGDGRVNLNTAPVPVLLTLPGVDRQGAAAIVARRRAAPFVTPLEIAQALPPGARERMQDRLAELAPRIDFTPREAEVRVTAAEPGQPVRATLTAVAVMAGGTQAAVSAVTER